MFTIATPLLRTDAGLLGPGDGDRTHAIPGVHGGFVAVAGVTTPRHQLKAILRKCTAVPIHCCQDMRLLAWNLNHRAHRHAIPGWIPAAIAEKKADVVVLTEYVEGPDHLSFVESLRKAGLRHASVSTRINKSNQVLIATREPHRSGTIKAPSFNESVPPNFLHVVVDALGTDVVGFRMPAFTGPERQFKRRTWEWLTDAICPLGALPCIVAGDFNTAVGDSTQKCGDCFQRLRMGGWQHADPGPEAVSYRTRNGAGRLIDHAFASPLLTPLAAECSWDFHKFGPDSMTGRFGRPDHAMLIIETRHAQRQ